MENTFFVEVLDSFSDLIDHCYGFLLLDTAFFGEEFFQVAELEVSVTLQSRILGKSRYYLKFPKNL